MVAALDSKPAACKGEAGVRGLKSATLAQSSWAGGRKPEFRVAAGDATPGSKPGTGRRGADREDEALLVRVAAHDPAAFRLLVDRHMPGLILLARRLLRDEAEAEDVAQEALLRLWRQGQGLEVGPAGIRPWLKRVVFEPRAIDKLRVRGRFDVTDEPPEQPQANTGTERSRRTKKKKKKKKNANGRMFVLLNPSTGLVSAFQIRSVPVAWNCWYWKPMLAIN